MSEKLPGRRVCNGIHFGALALMLSACSGGDSSSDYLGQWQQEGPGRQVIVTFASKGDTILFVDAGSTYPITKEANGSLSFIAPILGKAEFSLSEEGDSLYGMGDTFKRINRACSLDSGKLFCKKL